MPRKINLVRPAYVVYKHKSIPEDFIVDFGFQEDSRKDGRIYYRGTGAEPFLYCAEQGDDDVFGGAAFIVESPDDLDYAAETLPNATKVHDLDKPGGGKCVTFFDPVDGFPFHLVHGQKTRGDIEAFPQRNFNFPTEKNRSGNKTQRFEKGPAPVHRLGHFGLCVTNYKAAYDFYTTRFNFKPSELVHNEEGVDITTFLHLDRGKDLVDHHCFFFFEGPKFHVHHSSFETHDFDTQLLGHDWLRHKGYENCWGVGRHVMGSQIFDYWFDPSRFILEHYVDGDLVDDTYPINRTKAAPDSLHVWGPDLPPTFLQ